MAIIHFHNGNFADSDKNTLDSFIKLYVDGFTDPDERTNPDEWINQLSQPPENKKFETHIFVSREENDEKKVTGGIVLEYFPKSKSILLAYIIVDSNVRKSGLGKKLFNQITELIAFLKSKEKETVAVYAEIAIPWKVDGTKSPIPPELRVEIFRGMGAEWIDIPYVQPPLDETKEYVDHSFLIVFRDLTPDSKLQVSYVQNFLEELYRTLGIEKSSQDKFFNKMKEALSAITILVKQLPEFENPKLHFKDIVVCLHAVSGMNNAVIEDQAYNNNFQSFEFDILNHQNVENPPFCSKRFFEEARDVTIHFPQQLSYTSEGANFTLYTKTTELKARFLLHYTDFDVSKGRIWHLCFIPCEGETFDEYSIIKLLKLNGCGRQENFNATDNIRFSVGENKLFSIHNLFKILADKHFDKKSEIKTATVELNIPGLKNIKSDEFFKTLNAAIAKDTHYSALLQKPYETEDYNEIRYLLNAMCGISSGIFDFKRFSFTEMMDVLRPIHTEPEGTIIIIHKNNLCSFGHTDKLLSNFREQFAVNPYLLICHATLIYNEEMLRLASISIKEGIKRDIKKISKSIIEQLEEKRLSAERSLNLFYLKDVFHYPYEKTIFTKGLEERGLSSLLNHLNVRLKELTYRIESMNTRIRKRNDLIIGMLLGLLSGLQLQTIIDAFTRDYFSNFPHNGVPWMVFVGVLMLFLIIIYSSMRKGNK
ncbi:MAG: GNAT family N-acetyltransferase [Bacteroidota bacterium]